MTSRTNGRTPWTSPAVWVVVSALIGAPGSPVTAVAQGPAAPAPSLPRVTDLPSSYRPVGELADRGTFYASGTSLYRIDDGGSHHGFDALPVWERKAGARTQGVVYGVEDDAVVSAGYLVRQKDLVEGKSFHGLSLRELDFPPARYVTVDFVEGATEDENLYLWLWHFRSQYGPPRHMLPAGNLPPVESLPPRFSVYACEDEPDSFCPRMGRHYTDRSKRLGRTVTSTGDDGLSYGEAAGKLIFIEYSFAQKDFRDGVSWSPMPLDGLPIPPIDNVHILHYEGADSESGRFTLHMYFIPEETYLSWDREPPHL